MGYTIGNLGNGHCLVAACDGCGKVVRTYRDEDWMCVLPAGWQKVGKSVLVGQIYGVPITRSTLKCRDCVEWEARVLRGDEELEVEPDTWPCPGCGRQVFLHDVCSDCESDAEKEYHWYLEQRDYLGEPVF